MRKSLKPSPAQSQFQALRLRAETWALYFLVGGAGFLALSSAAYSLVNSAHADSSSPAAATTLTTLVRAPAAAEVDTANAIKYLDGRVQDWFETHNCLSCHSSYSYGMLSARLIKNPTQTGKTLEATMIQRIQQWDAGASWYGHMGSEKMTQSRATESVLNFVTLAQADLARGGGHLRAETKKAFSLMLSMQNTQGSWDWLDFSLRPFEDETGTYWGASLAMYTLGSIPEAEFAALTSGADAPVDALAKIEKVRKFLVHAMEQNQLDLHNRGALLLASTKSKGLLTDEQKATIKSDLLAARKDDGSYSMIRLARFKSTSNTVSAQYTVENAVEGDGYATGFVTWVLREAGSSDVELAPGVDWLKAHQRADGTWAPGTMNQMPDPGSQAEDYMYSFRRGIMTDLATSYALIGLNQPSSAETAPTGQTTQSGVSHAHGTLGDGSAAPSSH